MFPPKDAEKRDEGHWKGTKARPLHHPRRDLWYAEEKQSFWAPSPLERSYKLITDYIIIWQFDKWNSRPLSLRSMFSVFIDLKFSSIPTESTYLLWNFLWLRSITFLELSSNFLLLLPPHQQLTSLSLFSTSFHHRRVSVFWTIEKIQALLRKQVWEWASCSNPWTAQPELIHP